MKETKAIKSMFDKIVGRYDFLNHLLSFGQDILWRKKMAKEVCREGINLVLDLATGTADSAIAVMKNEVKVIGIDISFDMLKVGMNKIKNKKFYPVTGSGYQIPIKDNSVDVVTSAFGIRNMHDTETALKEIYRVIKKRGRIVILEFSLPENILRKPYLFYLRKIIPLIASAFSVKSAYEYLGQSIEKFYKPSDFVRILQSSGFKNIKAIPISFGCVYLYVGEKYD